MQIFSSDIEKNFFLCYNKEDVLPHTSKVAGGL